MKRYTVIFIISVILLALGCGVAPKEEEGFVLKSQAFVDGGEIPVKYACIYEPGGQNISPPLSWENPPSGTKSYVLFVHDPDAQSGDYIHWVVYDIPASYKGLAEGISGKDNNIKEGLNDDGTIGYTGPCPPTDDPPHNYVFELYALSKDTLGLSEGATWNEVRSAMESSVLAKAKLTGKYQAK